MYALIRLLLLIVAVIVSVAIIAAHGARGIGFLVLIALAMTVPRSRVWRTGERWLVRATGSRRRAAAVVLAVLIGALVAINVYEFVH